MALSLDGTTGITSDGGTPVIENLDTTATGIAVTGQLTTTGNVGIGTGSPGARLDVEGAAASNNLAIKINNTDTSGYSTLQMGGTDAGIYRNGSTQGSYGGNSSLNIITVGAHNIGFATNNTERARIDSSGNLLVGTTSAGGTGTNRGVTIGGGAVSNLGATYDYLGALYRYDSVNENGFGFWNTRGGASPTGGAVLMFYVGNSFTKVGSITTSTASTSYNTSSDYRLKENIAPMTGASERVKALKPVNFAWKADGSRVDGFLAHEAQAVVPEAVHGEKDAVDAEGKPVYQGIDQSKLVPLLTAALQEALAKIDDLTARVSALEAANV